MSYSLKRYIKYILLFGALTFGYIVSYTTSVVLMYMLIGFFSLPIFVIGYPVLTYILWSKTLKHVRNKFLKLLTIVVSFSIIVFLTIDLDSFFSWSKDGNLSVYLSLLGIK